MAPSLSGGRCASARTIAQQLPRKCPCLWTLARKWRAHTCKLPAACAIRCEYQGNESVSYFVALAKFRNRCTFFFNGIIEKWLDCFYCENSLHRYVWHLITDFNSFHVSLQLFAKFLPNPVDTIGSLSSTNTLIE
jgi:hypothetical protein